MTTWRGTATTDRLELNCSSRISAIAGSRRRPPSKSFRATSIHRCWWNILRRDPCSNRKDFATVSSPDGFAVDCAGNLYVASGTPGAIQAFSPSGTKLGSVTVASSLSNMAFGESDGKTLYITAGKALYSLDMNLPGYPY